MKLCRKCNTRKALSEFHHRTASSDGHNSQCKSCQKEYDASRLRDPKRMEMRRAYQSSPAGRSAHNRAAEAWAGKNATKRKAHIAVGNAIRDGKLIKSGCEVCGNPTVHGHHDDYAKPLAVRWLCDTHHNEWHRRHGEAINGN